ncbi:hypothetical protein AAFF_G00248940 [Aldrovandia affinis]|uniref:Uncharacterized protein n=1 Tax=Aldrovandia affinis TaxID=143900 RepID=A0AAD7W3I5_9TELE|nr:hypothetical protein AAFF_G00248940 [Aldrovandia affinis]
MFAGKRFIGQSRGTNRLPRFTERLGPQLSRTPTAQIRGKTVLRAARFIKGLERLYPHVCVGRVRSPAKSRFETWRPEYLMKEDRASVSSVPPTAPYTCSTCNGTASRPGHWNPREETEAAP